MRTRGKYPAAYQFAIDWQEMIESARDSLAKVARHMKKYTDQGRRPLEFQVRDQVWLKLTPQVWKKLHCQDVYKGLIARYDGLFVIV